MRVLVIIMGLLLASSSVHAQSIEDAFPARMPHRGECIKLTKQIIRYAGDAQMARNRGNASWEQSSIMQMDKLALRRHKLCPQLTITQDPAWRMIGQVLGIAAVAAIKYYTWGMF